MQLQDIIANPFALMMDPQGVVDAMERSERLQRLQRRVCRPLDKPLIPHADADQADFDREIERDTDTIELRTGQPI